MNAGHAAWRDALRGKDCKPLWTKSSPSLSTSGKAAMKMILTNSQFSTYEKVMYAKLSKK